MRNPKTRAATLRRSVTLTIGGLLLAPLTTPIQAETASTALIEEIVVTARMREEGLQDAPIAVSYTHLTLPTKRIV